MNSLTKSPRTTLGGIIALAAVGGLLLHKIDITTALTLLGIAAGWIGVTAKDSGASPPTTVTTAVTDAAGAKTTAVTTTTESQ